MPFTITPLTTNLVYSVRMTLQDYMGEQIRKASRLYNASNGLQDAMRAFESISNAGIIKASGAIQAQVSGQSTTVTTGRYRINDVLVLGFTRAHPLNAAKNINAYFGIPSPADAVIDITTGNTGHPVMTRGIDFASAAGVTEALGALVDWLEDSLTYLDVAGTLHTGGWTFAADETSLVSYPRIVGGRQVD